MTAATQLRSCDSGGQHAVLHTLTIPRATGARPPTWPHLVPPGPSGDPVLPVSFLAN